MNKKSIATMVFMLVMGFSIVGLTGCSNSSLHPYWDARLSQNGEAVLIHGLTRAGTQQRVLTVPKEIAGVSWISLQGRAQFPGGALDTPDLGNLEGVVFEGIPRVSPGTNMGFFGNSSLRWVELKSKQESSIQSRHDALPWIRYRFPVGTIVIYRQNNSSDFNEGKLDSSIIHVFADEFDASMTPDEIYKMVKGS